MATDEITIRVDADAAQAYRASEQKRKKIDLVLSIHLQNALCAPQDLQGLMSELNRKALERGLTPDILEEVLREEG